jgi:hypothetical protein
MMSRFQVGLVIGCVTALLAGCGSSIKHVAAAPGAVTSADFGRLMETVARGWNSNDARLAANCFTENALYSSPPNPRIRQGRNALFEFFGGAQGRPRPMHMEWHHLAFDEKEQVGVAEFTFTYDVRTHGIAIVRIAGGQIANWREYEHVSPLDWEALAAGNMF